MMDSGSETRDIMGIFFIILLWLVSICEVSLWDLLCKGPAQCVCIEGVWCDT